MSAWFENNSWERVTSLAQGTFCHGLFEVRFHEANVDLIYSRYRRQGDLALDESFFPVLWDESGYRTPWLAGLPDVE